ncbi:MAG: hypothetical protein ACRDZO_26000 [Egibacteraceae bacterium]
MDVDATPSVFAGHAVQAMSFSPAGDSSLLGTDMFNLEGHLP